MLYQFHQTEQINTIKCHVNYLLFHQHLTVLGEFSYILKILTVVLKTKIKSSFPELLSASANPPTVYDNDPWSIAHQVFYYKNMPSTHPENFQEKNCLLTFTPKKIVCRQWSPEKNACIISKPVPPPPPVNIKWFVPNEKKFVLSL